MTDENQNPQNQQNPQVQDQNQAPAGDDFDLFGGDDDIFENPDLLKWVEEGENDIPDDDIFVDSSTSGPATTVEPEVAQEPEEVVSEPETTQEVEVAPEPEIIEPETMEAENTQEDFDDFDDDIDVDYRNEEWRINNEEWEEDNEEWIINNEEWSDMSSWVEWNETKDIDLDSSVDTLPQNDDIEISQDDDTNDDTMTAQDDETTVPEPEKEEIFEPDENKSTLQNKFLELKFETEKIFRLVNKDFSKWFDLLGGNDDMKKITYKIFVDEDTISIDKVELNKADNSTQTHNLEFGIEDNSLWVYVDSEFLYDEVDDLQNDKNKAMQVADKLNKFIFLVTDEYKKIEREKRVKERNNQLKWTFRNF